MVDTDEIERDENGKVHRRARNRASRIRGRVAAGKTVRDEDRAYLAAYDQAVHGTADEPDDAEDGAATEATEPAAQVDAADAADAAAAAPPPKPPKPPKVEQGPPPPPTGRQKPPPRVHVGATDDAGRDQAVEIVASLWCGVLGRMAADLESVGVAPLISVDAIQPAIVATLRRNLPAQASATPEMIAGVGSSMILFQRWRARAQIAAAAAKARGEEARPVYAEQPAPPPPSAPAAAYVEPDAEIEPEPEDPQAAPPPPSAPAAAYVEPDAELEPDPEDPLWRRRRRSTSPAPPKPKPGVAVPPGGWF